MKNLINWEALRGLNREPVMFAAPDVNWDNEAEMYDKMAEMEREYTLNQLNALDVSKSDTVLDIGCGPGRISCEMARRAKKVTAIDAFPRMLEKCRQNADMQALENLETRLMDWHDAVLGENLEPHDIVIASRSVGMQDLKKLNDFAQKYAVVIAWANGPHIPVILGKMFAGTQAQKSEKKGPDFIADRRTSYNITWNMVYDMGAEPNIKIVKDGFTKSFKNEAEAIAWLRVLRPFDDQYLPVFKENLTPFLKEDEKGSVTFRFETRSFVLWWEPVRLTDV